MAILKASFCSAMPAAFATGLKQTAELGNMHAQFQIGLMYEAGVGTDGDILKAIKWYSLVARQKNKKAERRLYELLNG